MENSMCRSKKEKPLQNGKEERKSWEESQFSFSHETVFSSGLTVDGERLTPVVSASAGSSASKWNKKWNADRSDAMWNKGKNLNFLLNINYFAWRLTSSLSLFPFYLEALQGRLSRFNSDIVVNEVSTNKQLILQYYSLITNHSKSWEQLLGTKYKIFKIFKIRKSKLLNFVVQ